MNIALFQFNPGFYHNQSYLPYSTGMMWAYAQTKPEIKAGVRNVGFFFLREDPQAIVDRLEHVDVAAFSTYLWNWELTNQVAIRLKKRFPKALVIFGGPHVPNEAKGFLEERSYIDVVVHGEGEKTFTDILMAGLNGQHYSEIPGLSYSDPDGGFHCKQVVREPIMELDELPSPYLTGIFDHLFDLPIHYQATWETNRGCPYKCTFCYWGTDYAFIQKLRQFSMDRLLAELDYFGEHKIGHIYLADANFGILKRDMDIAERLVEVKASHNGYPGKFKANYAKNSTERVVQIARILNREKIDRGISLAVQSMDEDTLVNIKRKNLKIESFAKFMHQYQKEEIPTYVELILGMPGETYESFRDGISLLLNAGAHDAVFLHKGVMLPNTEMDGPEYRKEHEIQTKMVPATLSHSSKQPGDIQECEELIIGTKTMPPDDWKKSYMFAWVLQTCHILRLTQVPAVYASAYEGHSFGTLYEELIEFARRNPETVIGEELKRTEAVVEDALNGEGFDILLPEFSEIFWPPEEASFLKICLDLDRFYSEFADFMRELGLRHAWSLEDETLEDLLEYQKAIVVKWDRDGSQELVLNHSVHSFYRAQLEGRKDGLERGRYGIAITDELLYGGDRERFSREIAFWGRRGGQMNYKAVTEKTLDGNHETTTNGEAGLEPGAKRPKSRRSKQSEPLTIGYGGPYVRRSEQPSREAPRPAGPETGPLI
jgi:radical SAM superfamily enzyme YgiQ (UPF0313 family)